MWQARVSGNYTDHRVTAIHLGPLFDKSLCLYSKMYPSIALIHFSPILLGFPESVTYPIADDHIWSHLTTCPALEVSLRQPVLAFCWCLVLEAFFPFHYYNISDTLESGPHSFPLLGHGHLSTLCCAFVQLPFPYANNSLSDALSQTE